MHKFYEIYYNHNLIDNDIISPSAIIDSYITNVYFMILTFTTVGYGDISLYKTFTMGTGDNNVNQLALYVPVFIIQFIMEFLGMCIFGYFLGTMRQNLSLKEENIIKQFKEDIFIWITKLQKSRFGVYQNDKCLHDIREFLIQFWTKNHSIVLNNEFYSTLPDTLRRNVLEVLFASQKNFFSILFQHTEESFYKDFLSYSIQKW